MGSACCWTSASVWGGRASATRDSASCSTPWRARATNSSGWMNYWGRGDGRALTSHPGLTGWPPANWNDTNSVKPVPPVRKLCALLLTLPASFGVVHAEEIFIRASQGGYWPQDARIGIAFAKTGLPASFTVVTADFGVAVVQGKTRPVTGVKWGQFERHVALDFSALKTPGRVVLQVGGSMDGTASGHHALGVLRQPETAMASAGILHLDC